MCPCTILYNLLYNVSLQQSVCSVRLLVCSSTRAIPWKLVIFFPWSLECPPNDTCCFMQVFDLQELFLFGERSTNASLMNIWIGSLPLKYVSNRWAHPKTMIYFLRIYEAEFILDHLSLSDFIIPYYWRFLLSPAVVCNKPLIWCDPFIQSI